MTYMFSYIHRGTKEVPFVRVSSQTESETIYEIGSHQTIKLESQFDIVIHDFTVGQLFKEDQDTEKTYYKWYFIENYTKQIDTTPSVKLIAEQNAANIDYIMMMTGIDIPEEDDINESEV